MELKNLSKIVIEILKQFDFTRGDDDLLYLNVLVKLDGKRPTEDLMFPDNKVPDSVIPT